MISHSDKRFGRDAQDRRDGALKNGINGAWAALETFYYAFNQQSINAFAAVWAEEDLIQLNNPLGGIQRGYGPIQTLYQKIFNGPAKVWVEFDDIIAYIGADTAIFAGRETGEFEMAGQTVPLQIRTSRVFHYFGAQAGWRQIHHHGSIDDPNLLQRYQAAVNGQSIPITTITIATVQPEQVERFTVETQQLVTLSRQEEAVQRFDLYQSTEAANQFLFHETFDSMAALEQHRAEPHTQSWFKAVSPILDRSPFIENLKAAE